jgi:adenylate cyclase class IV
MEMQRYEVEVKALLGSEESAEVLRARMRHIDPASKLISRNKQLNHYFMGGDLKKLAKAVAPHFLAETFKKFKDLAQKARDVSVRTRQTNKGEDNEVFLVVKASVGDDTSSNGVTRMEFEEKFNPPAGGLLDDLDQLLMNAGFVYQAKWSREREEYVCQGIAVCLDRNAGYGWLAEFEKVVDSEHELENARSEVRSLMDACGVLELQQERLERMFAFYNAHWGEYYGTDKVFTIA